MFRFFMAIINFFFGVSRNKKKPQAKNNQHSTNPESDSIVPAEAQNIEVRKDKIMFQPNMLHARNPLEYPPSKASLITDPTAIPLNSPPQLPPGHTPTKHTITLECSETTIMHLQSLCRYFELSQPEAIARGVWLLTIARDIEIANKKLGVLTTDHNGLVVDVVPVNIV